MPSTPLRSALDDLAQSFASGVLQAIRRASIEDLLAGPSAGKPGPARGGTTAGNPGPRAATKGGRLPRRSAEEIAQAVGQVVALVKQSNTGLRSEQIKKALRLDRREVPRILKTGLASKKLKAKGQKRATTYSAA